MPDAARHLAARPAVASAAETTSLVGDVVRRLIALGRTVATAESLTGGLVAAAITQVPGASQVYRGGVVAYATDVKHSLLNVDEALLARVGAVHREVAAAMAAGARDRLGATYGLSTTGVAGPAEQDGHRPGTVWVGVADRDRCWALNASWPADQLGLDRRAVRTATVIAAWAALAHHLAGDGKPAG